MTTMLKRTLSLILSLIMVFSMIPASVINVFAVAATGDGWYQVEENSNNFAILYGKITGSELNDLLDVAYNGNGGKYAFATADPDDGGAVTVIDESATYTFDLSSTASQVWTWIEGDRYAKDTAASVYFTSYTDPEIDNAQALIDALDTTEITSQAECEARTTAIYAAQDAYDQLDDTQKTKVDTTNMTAAQNAVKAYNEASATPVAEADGWYWDGTTLYIKNGQSIDLYAALTDDSGINLDPKSRSATIGTYSAEIRYATSEPSYTWEGHGDKAAEGIIGENQYLAVATNGNRKTSGRWTSAVSFTVKYYYYPTVTEKDNPTSTVATVTSKVISGNSATVTLPQMSTTGWIAKVSTGTDSASQIAAQTIKLSTTGTTTVTVGPINSTADATISVEYTEATSYSITVSVATDTPWGTASASASSSIAGDTITITATPNTNTSSANYAYSKLTVNGTEQTGLTFTMPEGNVEVVVYFSKIELSGNSSANVKYNPMKDVTTQLEPLKEEIFTKLGVSYFPDGVTYDQITYEYKYWYTYTVNGNQVGNTTQSNSYAEIGTDPADKDETVGYTTNHPFGYTGIGTVEHIKLSYNGLSIEADITLIDARQAVTITAPDVVNATVTNSEDPILDAVKAAVKIESGSVTVTPNYEKVSGTLPTATTETTTEFKYKVTVAESENNLSAELEVTVNAVLKQFTISWDTDDDGEVEETTTVYYNVVPTPPDAVAKEGWTATWPDRSAATADVTYTVVYTKDTVYTVTYVTSIEGYTIAEQSYNVTQNPTITVVAPDVENQPQSYKAFEGWYTDAELTNKYTFGTTPTENITLYAKWVADNNQNEVRDDFETVNVTISENFADYGSVTLSSATTDDPNVTVSGKETSGFTVFYNSVAYPDGVPMVVTVTTTEPKGAYEQYLFNNATKGVINITVKDGTAAEATHTVQVEYEYNKLENKTNNNVQYNGYYADGTQYDNIDDLKTAILDALGVTLNDAETKVAYGELTVKYFPYYTTKTQGDGFSNEDGLQELNASRGDISAGGYGWTFFEFGQRGYDDGYAFKGCTEKVRVTHTATGLYFDVEITLEESRPAVEISAVTLPALDVTDSLDAVLEYAQGNTTISCTDSSVTVDAPVWTRADTNALPTKDSESKTDELKYTVTVEGTEKYQGNVFTVTVPVNLSKYTVNWNNGDANLETDTDVYFGSAAEYNGTTPTKTSQQYTYAFIGWTANKDKTEFDFAEDGEYEGVYKEVAFIPAVSGDVTYYAAFSRTVNKYTVTWNNDNGELLKSDALDYGAIPSYTGTPTKAATAQYTYEFIGWTTDSENTIFEKADSYAGIITDFTGITVTDHVTYYAAFSRTVNKYTVTWMNGTEIEKDENVPYGDPVSYDGVTPTKAATAQYTYEFIGWTTTADKTVFDKNEGVFEGVVAAADLAKVSGNATYYAAFSYTTNTYTIIWVDEDGTVLETDENVPYGETPKYDGEAPTKSATDEKVFTFDGWTPEINTVTGNQTYKAVYTDVAKIKVTFKVLEDTSRYTNVVPNEKVSAYTSPNIEGYEFDGWYTDETYTTAFDFANTVITAEITIYAKMTKLYTVTFKTDGSAVEPQTIRNGEKATRPATDPTRDGYVFDGWDFDFDTAIKADTVIVANWKKLHTVKFDVVGGTPEVDNQTVVDGETANIPSAPYKVNYLFKGWTLDGVIYDFETPVTGDIELKAYYVDDKDNDTLEDGSDADPFLTYIWLDSDGTTQLHTATILSGATTPTFAATDTTTDNKTFVEWTESVDGHTTTYTAVWAPDANNNAVDDNDETVIIAIEGSGTLTINGTEYKNGDKYVFNSTDTTAQYTFVATPSDLDGSNGVAGYVASVSVAGGTYANGVYTVTTSSLTNGQVITVKFDTFGQTASGDYKISVNGYVKQGIRDDYSARLSGIKEKILVAVFGDGINAGDYTVSIWLDADVIGSDHSWVSTDSTGFTTVYGNQVEIPGTEFVQIIKSASADGKYVQLTWDNVAVKPEESRTPPTFSTDKITVKANTHDEFIAAVKAEIVNRINNSEITVDNISVTSDTYTGNGEYTVIVKVTNEGSSWIAHTDDNDVQIKVDATVNSYTVTWNVDGVKTSVVYEYGATVEKLADPSKVGYTFNGWLPEFTETMGAADVEYVAQWKINTHKVTWTINGETHATQDVNYDADITIPAYTASEGYTFSGWTNVPEKMPDEDLTLDATLTANIYTVTWNINDEFHTSTNVTYGETITVPEYTVPTGYIFSGWDAPETMPAENITINATLTLGTFMVTWTINGVEYTTTEVEFGKAISVPSYIVPEGHTFTTWTNIPETMPAEDITIDATLTANTYQVTWNPNGGTWNNGGTDNRVESYTYGDSIVPPTDLSKSGYNLIWNVPNTMGASNVEYIAEWVNGNTVTFNDGTNTTSKSYAKGEAIIIPERTPKTGYTFVGWDLVIANNQGDNIVDTPISNMGDSSVVYVALWKVNQYSITFINEDGSTYHTITDDYDKEITAPAAPTKTGYEFVGWDLSVDGEYDGIIDTVPTKMAAENLTFKPIFSILQYTITFNTAGGSTITAITQDYGTDVIAPANPTKIGYSFAGWDKEIPTTMPAENVTITASWTIKHFTITWIPNGGTWTDADLDENGYLVQTYEYGATITAPDNPSKDKAIFNSWDSAIPGKMPAENLTITAKWLEDSNENGKDDSLEKVNVVIEGNGSISIGYMDGETFVAVTTVTNNGSYVYDSTKIAAIQVTPADLNGSDGSAGYVDSITIGSTAVTLLDSGFAGGVYTFTASDLANGQEIKAVIAERKFVMNPIESGKSYEVKMNGYYSVYDQCSAIESAILASLLNGSAIANYDASTKNIGVDGSVDLLFMTLTGYRELDFGFGDGIQLRWGNEVFKIGETESVQITLSGDNRYPEIVGTFEIVVKESRVSDPNALTATWNGGTVYANDKAHADGQITAGNVSVTGVNGNVGAVTITKIEGTVPTELGKSNDLTCTVTIAANENYTEITKTITVPVQLKKYTIKWVNEDGTKLDEQSVGYGINPVYSGDTPSKAADAEFTYTFSAWSPAVVVVTGDATYKATYSTTTNEYTITFKNEDGTVLQSGKLAYGATPSYSGTPTKAATAQYTYTFAGWDKEISTVTGEATYTATYTATVNKYTIKFVNEDGTELQSSEFAYGETPVYNGETPIKAATAQHTYTFAGWSPDVASVTGEATYTAIYTHTVNTYTITWNAGDGTFADGSKEMTTTVAYGDLPVAPATPDKADDAQNDWSFTGWNPTIATVTGNATYTAQYGANVVYYTVTWYAEDGTTPLGSKQWAYGSTPSFEGTTPTKESNEQYSYSFDKWIAVSGVAEDGTITGDASYKATFKGTLNKYTITFKNDDGTVLQSTEVEYGATPEYKGTTPAKAATAQYTYTFDGWDNEIAEVSGTATYTATFKSTVNEYTITWLDGDGNTLKTEQVAYGETPVYTGNTPTKTATAQYTYIFNNTWSPEVASVTGNATYTAQFDSKVNEYTIKFVNADGTVLQETSVAYGTTPSYTGSTPVKTSDTYVYSYIGWDNEIVSVTGNATYTAQFEASALNAQNGTIYLNKSIQDASTHLTNLKNKVLEAAGLSINGSYTVTTMIGMSADIPLIGTRTVNAKLQINNDGIVVVDIPSWANIVSDYINQAAPTLLATALSNDPSKDFTITDSSTGFSKTVVHTLTDIRLPAVVGEMTQRDFGRFNTQDDFETAVKALITATWTDLEGNSGSIEHNARTGIVVTFSDPVDSTNENGETVKTYTVTVKVNAGANWLATTEDTVLEGVYWTVNQYTVTFNTNTESTIEPITVDYGTVISAPTAPTKTGHTFGGWYTDAACSEGNEFDFASGITADTTIYAKWTINQYTITFDTNGGSEIAAITLDYGAAVTAPADPTKTGYTFAGWDKEIPATMPAEDVTITASWTINQYTITFDTAGGSEIATITQDYGTAVTAPAAPTKEGHTFAGWDVEVPAAMPAADMTITAQWTANSYTVTWKPNGGTWADGTTDDLVQTYEYGATITAPANLTNAGYNLNWGTVASTMGAGNLEYTAQWTKGNTVTFYDGTDSTTTAYATGATIIKPADPTKEGYDFAGWDANGDGEADEVITTMGSENVVYVALWNAKTYKVTWIVDGQIYTTTDVAYGTAITVPEAPTKAQSGCTTYTFTGWEGFNDGMKMPAGDQTFAAVFTEGVSHTSDEFTYVYNENGTHTKKYACCDAVSAESETCSDIEGDKDHLCDNCKAEGTSAHKGGKATCMAAAICEECDKSYGDKDPENHTKQTTTVKDAADAECGKEGYTGDTYCECGVKIETGTSIPATGNHIDGDDKNHDCDNCDATNVDDGCHGGTATCMAPATCDECGQPHGNKNPENHTKQNTTVKDAADAECGKEGYTGDTYCECGVKIETGTSIPATGNHVDGDDNNHDCDNCDATNVDDGCQGGKATCKTPATCEECGQSYGTVNSSAHEGTATWTSIDADNHTQAYSCCGATVVATEAHEWNALICTKCGYSCRIAGDINADGKVNLKDVVLLYRFVDGWDVVVDHDALDTNGDGIVGDIKDAVHLFKFVAGHKGLTLYRKNPDTTTSSIE